MTAYPIYLDNNSTTATLPAVVEAMQPFWSDTSANPSSPHRAGQRARRALDQARVTIAACLDAHPDEILFTSGATEANNLAVFGLGDVAPGVVLTSALEHPSVLEPMRELARQRGHILQMLEANRQGRIDELPSSLPAELRLFTVQLANHEMGVIQPAADFVQLAGVCPVHCDATQAVGRIPVSFHILGVTSMSCSAHKFHGPKGVGALLLRKETPLRPMFFGGPQQSGLRPGTEPVALVVGMAKALELACAEMAARTAHILHLRRLFLERLQAAASPVILNGQVVGGVPHTLNIAFPGCDAPILLMNLDLAGVACSAGAACASGSLLPSPVLRAMGLPEETVRSSVRFSLSHLLTEEDMLEVTKRIGQVVRRLREISSLPDARSR